MTGFFGQPAQDTELAIAVRLLDHDANPDLDIVDALVGHPHRYSELRPLLHGRNDNVLNRALARLRDDGVIEQRLDLAHRQRVYALTELGKLVYGRIQQMRPFHEGIEAYQRGQAAASA